MALAVVVHAHTVAVASSSQALRVELEFDTFALEDRLHFRRYVFVLAPDETRPHFDHGDATAEAAIHLSELEPDVAPSDDDEVLGQEVDVHHARVVEVTDCVESFDPARGRAPPDIEENLRRFQRLVVYANTVRTFESRVSVDDRQVGRLLEPAPDPLLRFRDDCILARLHLRHVDANVTTDLYAVLARIPRNVRGARAGDEGLGRNTSV